MHARMPRFAPRFSDPNVLRSPATAADPSAIPCVSADMAARLPRVFLSPSHTYLRDRGCKERPAPQRAFLERCIADGDANSYCSRHGVLHALNATVSMGSLGAQQVENVNTRGLHCT